MLRSFKRYCDNGLRVKIKILFSKRSYRACLEVFCPLQMKDTDNP